MRVIANDLKPERLDEISRSLSAEERGRLTLAPGDALQLVIPSASLGGILATRWINVLRPYECRLLMNDFYRWLAPGGILCITAHTPYSNTTKGNRYKSYQRLHKILNRPANSFSRENFLAFLVSRTKNPEKCEGRTVVIRAVS